MQFYWPEWSNGGDNSNIIIANIIIVTITMMKKHIKGDYEDEGHLCRMHCRDNSYIEQFTDQLKLILCCVCL